MFEFKLPEVGENIKSGTVIKIAVKVGDVIKKNQTLLELETDKAALEVPSPVDGTIKEILIKENDEVKIGQLVMKIDETTSATTTTPARHPEGAKATEGSPKRSFAAAQDDKTVAKPVQMAQPVMPMRSMSPQRDVAAAPSVRRFAREIGIEIGQVLGTGPGGRISLDDVKAYSKALNTSRASGGVSVPTRSLPDFSKWGSVERKPMNNVRKKTAEHMTYCWTTIPHVTQFDKADITELEKIRKEKSTDKRKLTITPFLLKVMASALKTFPQFNASIDMSTNEIIEKKYFNIGVAVDTDRGLLVPVIKDIDKKSIIQLADELNEMAERARTKKTTLDELQGGSITLTNLGGIGGTYFTPIVNWPEVSILGISRGAWEPVYEKGAFVPRFKLPLSLSYDHRLIDGADGARFLRWIAEAIEKPDLTGL